MKKMFINPLFFIFIVFLFVKGFAIYFLMYLIALTIHELSHLLTAKKLGYSLNKCTIMPYGICLNFDNVFFSEEDEFKIAIAGPLSNFLTAVIIIAVWWIKPETYYFTSFFCYANFILGAFNMIPCYPLDGGRILVNLIAKKHSRELGIKITTIINYVVSIFLAILFVISVFYEINYTYIFTAIFLFSSTIEPKKYTSYNSLNLALNRNKALAKGSSIKFIAISSEVPLYKIKTKFSKYKYNIVYVIFPNKKIKILTENNIEEYMICFGPTKNLLNIYKESCKL